MNIKSRIFAPLTGFIFALAIAPAASADTISGYGTWGSTAPVTAYSAPGETWYFSFNLPNPIASNPSTQVTNFTYQLNGTQVATSLPGGVLFFPVSQGGGFDLFAPLDSSTGATIISLYFPADVGSNLSLALGNYSAQIAINDGNPMGSGTVNITPEPPSILLFGTALLITGGFIYGRRNPHSAIQPE